MMADGTAWVPMQQPLPQAHDAEQAVLGSLLVIGGKAWQAVCGNLDAADFAANEHRALFTYIAEAHAAGRQCDPIALGPVAKSDPALVDAGGTRWLMELAEAAVAVVSAEQYAQLVRDCRQRRDAIAAIDEARGRLFDVGDADAQSIAASTLSRLQPIADDTATPSRVISWPALDGVAVPSREWLVPDWIPHQCVALLSGDGGIGKTLLAQMLMTAGAIDGGTWLGTPVQRCRSLGIFAEDDEGELWRRQTRICDHYGVRLADIGDSCAWPRVGEQNFLMTFGADAVGTLTPFWYEVRAKARAHRARLILLDTAAELFPGNQNDAAAVRQFVNGACGRLARDCGAAVLLTSHPSLAGMSSGTGTSGSVQWNAAVRSRLYLTRPKPAAGDDPDDDARVLTRQKSNYSASGSGTDIQLHWRDGVFVPDGASDGGMVEAIEKRTRERDAESAFLACLDAAAEQGRYASDSDRSPNYAPKMFLSMEQRNGFKQRDLKAAMDRLFNGGRIRVGEAKTSNRHPVSAIVKVVEL